MNIADFPDDSESSDEDYTPDKSNADLPSEEESDGECEDALPESEELSKRGSKRKKQIPKSKKKLKTQKETNDKKVDEEETEDLWASFKQDTGFKTRAQIQNISKQTSSETPKQVEPPKVENTKKVIITETYKFAGEEVQVEREVTKTNNDSSLLNKPSGSNGPKPKGGLSSVLNKLGKKTKITTLEKSKLDWDKFKKDEQIEDELSAYGKSKDGYLERQDFLQRADLRQFEIEKNVRNSLRSNRVNNFNV